MYSKTKDKFSFQQQYPFYSTCNPNTLKFSGRMMDDYTSASALTKRTSSTVVSVKSAHEDDEGHYEIPDKVSYPIQKSGSSSPSSYWSRTFAITTLPFIFWGGPFYLFLIERPPIRTTRKWLQCLVDCSKHPFLTLLTFIILILTVFVNLYFLYIFSTLINSLFIAGVYETSLFYDLIDFIRDIPVVIPLNYVWLRGFQINNIVTLLNQKYRMYSQIACGGYRLRLVLLMIVTICVHVIRYFSYRKYTFTDLTVLNVWKTIWEFSVDIFVTLTFPVYCTFCYAIRFELSIIKTLVYEMISRREVPEMCHLSRFKILYTHAADHIKTTNSFFSIYLSLTILLTIVGTIVDAENLIASVKSIFVSIFSSLFGGPTMEVIGGFLNETMNFTPPIFPLPPMEHLNHSNIQSQNVSNATMEERDPLDPVTVRKVNADIACIVLVYILIFFTIWQAVVTNDWARQVHVWLNDFVSGAGGTDVKGALMDLGVVEEDDHVNDVSSGLDISMQDDYQESADSLIWARNRITADGQTDQFLEKFRLLKSYIHVRMQLENPALLTVALVGLIIPSLSGRLKRYNIMF